MITDAGNGARSALAASVTGNYFQVLSAPPARGRSFTAEEERPGAGIRVAIISYQLWEQLGAGADIDDPDPDEMSPLLMATESLNFDTARFLLERGADPNKWDRWGRAPLYAAVDMSTLRMASRSPPSARTWSSVRRTRSRAS